MSEKILLLKNKNMVRCKWQVSVIPVLRRLKQENCEFKASLGGRRCGSSGKVPANQGQGPEFKLQ
jgi:hypothetical protein